MMTVRELIGMLYSVPNLDVEVTASDTYGEGVFEITSMIFNNDSIELTGDQP